MCIRNAFCAAAVASLAVLGGLWAQNSSNPAVQLERGLTLKTDRKVEFSTDEGTWMSVDVSPDGRTLVFDLLGHLYTLPIEGGTATEITSGLEFDGQPRYSPDGRHIVFLSDRSGDDNIWLA